MRRAAITTSTHGAALVLALASGTTMLLASSAQDSERAAVARRRVLDQRLTSSAKEIFAASELAREYALRGDPSHLVACQREGRALAATKGRVHHLRDAGAGGDELECVQQAIRLSLTRPDCAPSPRLH